jgi:Fur family zinc uptake transcriptional regulator
MTEELSHNQIMVHKLLEKSDKPMKAYRILFEIQKKGIKSPTQVYRALDKLMKIGKVHKIESQNSYIACNNSDCLNQLSTSFLICNKCEKIIEIEEKVIFDQFAKICKKFDRKYQQHKLEIFGTCVSCSEKN